MFALVANEARLDKDRMDAKRTDLKVRRRRWPKASVYRGLSPRKNRPQRSVALRHRIFSYPGYSAIRPPSRRISADSHRRQQGRVAPPALAGGWISWFR